MKIILLCNTEQQEELTAQGLHASAELIYADDAASLTVNEADACVDLLFDNSSERIKKLSNLRTEVIAVNSVVNTLKELPSGYVRINGWNTFLKRPLIEAAGHDSLKKKTEQLFSSFNKKVEWIPDIPGFISARVLASIINEAYFAFQEQVSTKEEIDIAMRLGTNYPFGPFEWSQKIGLKKIYHLLTRLSENQKRYTPAESLRNEVNI
ncbi:MAG TPA: 3-hydroxyacyl-CoA dehydrogenase family protein [Chitinophagaceae bacterium]|nr:3-hydroxyacyl-CoA dehydrogenase family protein [Chitinophagaceae bacterium]